MNRFTPMVSCVALLTIASPLYAQTKPLPPGQSLIQSAYSAYDTSKTIQVRILASTKNSDGKVEATEMTVAVENDETGKIKRGRMQMKQTTGASGEDQKKMERYVLHVDSESFLVAPQEKKYALREPENRHFAEFFRSILGSVVDAKTTYSVAEAKMNGTPVYQITTSAMNGLRTTITLEKESRLFRRIQMTFGKTETLGDFKVESQQRNAPIPEETFAKPGADFTLDPTILEKS